MKAVGRGGKAYLWALAAFFAIVLAVNSTMAWLAIGSFPGLVSDQAYDQGRTYNRNLSAAAAQARLGWNSRVEVTPRRDHLMTISIWLTDRAGSPVRGAAPSARLERPVDAVADIVLALAEPTPGHFTADLPRPAAGVWNLHFRAARGADLHVVDHRLTLR